MTLGEKICKLRTQKGLSQEVLGEKLGVSRQSVSKWETDQSAPELDKIVAMSELFLVSTDYLLKEEADEPMEIFSQEQEASCGRACSDDRPHYEYKSKKMVGSLPLVHIQFGVGLYRAKGIIAIGPVAQGILAVGVVSMGVVSVGIISLGLLALGTFAFGLAAFGSLAVGVITFGAFSVGIFSLGAMTFGQFAFGASAHGAQVAVGDAASGKIALGYSRAVGTYTEVSDREPFDYENACRLIDAHVSSNWLFFKSWAKAVVKWF